MRLGYINYLNFLPVYYGLEVGRTAFDGDLITGTPSRINHLFHEGLVDVAPISSIEYARSRGSDAPRLRDAVLLPGLSVSSWGHVQSILLISRRAPEDLEGATVAFTSASATSVVLARVLLQRYWGVSCDGRTEPPDLDRMLATADAALLIGDDALRAGLRLGVLPWRSGSACEVVWWRGEALVVTDLGAAWWEFKGLPMVFAVFAAHAGATAHSAGAASMVQTAMDVLERSRADAAADVAGLLHWASQVRGFPPDLAASYLLGSIRHDLGPLERQGLTAFYREAAAIGELDSVPELRLADGLIRMQP